MGNNIYLSPNDTAAFGHALRLISESMNNLKDVFQNMLPDVLNRHGLKRMLTELCDLVKKDYQLSTDFNFEGNEKRIDPAYEMAMYEMAVELISNVIKHANATSLRMQLEQSENRLVLNVKDNGKGFDATLSAIRNGTGLNKIRTQLISYHGWLSITSEPGNGAEVVIELNF